MNKYISGIVVVLVIVAGVLFVRTRTTPPVATQTETPQSDATKIKGVTYTDQGFVPTELTVKQGEVVTFTNQSSEPMWVASNPHPIHTLYPGFDEKASVPQGGSYSFTFDKVGTHPYHNHFHPGNQGTIIVE